MTRPNRKRMTIRKCLVRGLKPPYGLQRPLEWIPVSELVSALGAARASLQTNSGVKLLPETPDHTFAPGEDGRCSRWRLEASRCDRPAGEHDG